MKDLHPVLKEIVHLMKQIQTAKRKLPKASIPSNWREKGLESSKLGSSQPSEVAMTPLMKNALVHYGDTKVVSHNDATGEDELSTRIKTNDPETKAESAIIHNMKQLLLRFNGNSDTYNDALPLLSVEHYNVQCYQNMKDNLRDIQPGQDKERNKLAHLYMKKSPISTDQIIKMIETDVVFQKAILLIMGLIPEVKASSEIREINLPFMTKHSGVGAPYWKNDRTIDPESKKTYAELTMEIAERIKDKPDEWYKYNVSTMYGRNQRGKGRLLVAVARVLNLLLNQLESVEIESYKRKSPLFIGYRNDEELKQALITMAQECEKYGLKCANEDYKYFDLSVSEGMLVLVGAISIYKANGSNSKRIALMRACFALETKLMNGLSNSVDDIFGRIFSGFIDTNRGGGIANAIQMTTCCMKQDPNYSELCYMLTYFMMVMGDDNLHVYKSLDRKKLDNDMHKLFGGTINQPKYEFGPVFLQYRVFKDPKTQDIVMAYAWPRVARSMLMKEEAKGLGPVGWTYAWYQQLWKLYEYKEAFSIVVNLLIKFDQNEFFRSTPIKTLNAMLKKEDEEALNKLKTDNQKRRYQSTMDKLYDGDPSKTRFMEDNENLMVKIQNRINEVYDPQFYSKYGLTY